MASFLKQEDIFAGIKSWRGRRLQLVFLAVCRRLKIDEFLMMSKICSIFDTDDQLGIVWYSTPTSDEMKTFTWAWEVVGGESDYPVRHCVCGEENLQFLNNDFGDVYQKGVKDLIEECQKTLAANRKKNLDERHF